jgi:protein-L-isoaspartate(D-aspartate) O-methyltransferase
LGKRELLESLKEKGIPETVVDAINKVHREDFVPLKFKFQVYEDKTLEIDIDTKLAQPSITAFMLKLLDVHTEANVLEIGSGTGYILGILSKLAPNGKVRGIEIKKEFVESSKKVLEKSTNVEVHRVNGRSGFLRYAPYDRIIVSASFPYTPYRLVDQLKINGVLVAQVGNRIIKIKRYIDGTREKVYSATSFIDIQ